MQNTLVNNALVRWGNPEQKKKYLSQLAAEKVGAYALSEAGSGSDAFAMQTRAVDGGDHFVVNGRKLWITNGKEAEIFVLFANANHEAGSAASPPSIVEKTTKAFQSARKKTTRHSRFMRQLTDLEDCKVRRKSARRNRQGLQSFDANFE